MIQMKSTRLMRKTAIAFSALVMISFLGLLVWGMMNRQPITGLSGITMVHRPAPDFHLNTFDGASISLSDLRGKPVVINFWASWCPPCRYEAPLIENAWRLFEKRDVVFIGVNVQDKKEDALRYLREFNITYPNGPDPTGEIGINYGVSGLPVTFFVSREGEIVRRWVGALDPKELMASIQEIMR